MEKDIYYEGLNLSAMLRNQDKMIDIIKKQSNEIRKLKNFNPTSDAYNKMFDKIMNGMKK